jgi:hypothetical protein
MIEQFTLRSEHKDWWVKIPGQNHQLPGGNEACPHSCIAPDE